MRLFLFHKIFSFSIFISLILGASIFNTPPALAKSPISKKTIEQQVEQALSTFYTPGMSVGIVHKGEIVLSQGYGLANIDTQQAVDANTYFRLASTSKAFTAAALAVLVDEGKINWDDKVTEYLPNFTLYDPYVTREFTITDLLTHRSGLLSGAGDSMIWPEPSGFSRDEVIHNLRFLTPEYSFRARYAYSNVLYITAGELVAAVSQMSFDDFVEKHIFKPLNMNCFVGDMPKASLKNVASAYGHNDERGIYPIPRNGISEQGLMSAAAGGMVCNATSMNKWMLALLTKQNLPVSEAQLNTIWSPHTILGISSIEEEWDNTLFKNYGLGWRLSNIEGIKVISHTGTLSGYQAYVVLIPELELGVTVLNNGSHSGARGSVMQTIIKAYLSNAGVKSKASTAKNINSNEIDWVKTYVNYYDEREQAYLAKNIQDPIASAPMSIKDQQIIGEYQDKWYGSLVITQHNKGEASPVLRIHSTRMPTLVGSIMPFQDASYKIEWDNKNAAGPAFMHFKLNVNREIVSATLHPFTTKDIVNHEYRDMEFFRVEL